MFKENQTNAKFDANRFVILVNNLNYLKYLVLGQTRLSLKRFHKFDEFNLHFLLFSIYDCSRYNLRQS